MCVRASPPRVVNRGCKPDLPPLAQKHTPTGGGISGGIHQPRSKKCTGVVHLPTLYQPRYHPGMCETLENILWTYLRTWANKPCLGVGRGFTWWNLLRCKVCSSETSSGLRFHHWYIAVYHRAVVRAPWLRVYIQNLGCKSGIYHPRFTTHGGVALREYQCV